jgi:hypothetical protein
MLINRPGSAMLLGAVFAVVAMAAAGPTTGAQSYGRAAYINIVKR